jgi:hypothetical protein
MEPKTVEVFGQREKVGDWIVVDPTMTRVLAADSTPEKALRKAGIDPWGAALDEPRPVIMQVPDPSLTCLY